MTEDFSDDIKLSTGRARAYPYNAAWRAGYFFKTIALRAS